MEALVFLANNVTTSDPARERRGCWKRGMIVDVHPDGWTWGRLESKQVWIAEGRPAAEWPSQGRMAILKIPGASVARARALLEDQRENDAGTPQATTFRRRRWRLVFDNLPAGVRATVATDGEFTTTLAAVRTFLRRIRDDAQFTGLDE